MTKELHKEWDRSGVTKASVIISLEEVDGINDKLKEIIYQTQKSVDEDELTFKQSIAKSKECYVLLRVVRKIAKKKNKYEKQAIDNEFAIELDKDEFHCKHSDLFDQSVNSCDFHPPGTCPVILLPTEIL